MAKVVTKTEEIRSVTLTLSKDEAEAIRLLAGQISIFTDPVVYGPVSRVRNALIESGVRMPDWASRFNVAVSVARGRTL